MKPFDFLTPSTLDEALAALHDAPSTTRPLAGGQSLLLEMKERAATPARLVSLGGLEELRGSRYADSGELIVGAATTYAALADARLDGWHGLIPRVAGDLADRPVRTMGTIGGALCQANPRFDMPALAVGLDAKVTIASAVGGRTATAAQLLDPAGGATLRPNEILTKINFPALPTYSGAAFEKVRDRMFDAAVASAVCAISLGEDDRVVAIRLVLGALAPAPVLAERTAQRLVGTTADEHDVGDAAAIATDEVATRECAGTRQWRYQRELVSVLVCRAVNAALHQARRS